MNCDEARGRFASLLVGQLGLSEWAAVEAHVGHCAECGQELDQLYPVTPQDRTRRKTATVRSRARPRRGTGPRLSRLAIITTVLVALLGFGMYGLQRRFEDTLGHLRTAPPTAVPLNRSTVQSRVEPSPPDLAAPPTITPPVEPEPQNAVQTRRVPRERAAKPEPPVEPVVLVPASGTDITIQLSVPDRRAAERDVRALLARLGGTNLNRKTASTMMLVVPRSSFGALTRGLAQIGAWQIDSDPGSLPDPVHVAVRLSK
jgi:hypothetical protein